MNNINEYFEFSIKVKMRLRWVPHFLAMLKRMQYLGAIGSSRQVTFYSDGDGDFRPIFEWDKDLPECSNPVTDAKGHHVYDAG